MAPPKVFWRSAPFLKPVALLNQGVASSLSLRKNSNTEPRNWLVPLLSVRVTTPPPDLPYSAENVLFITFSSSVASMEG